MHYLRLPLPQPQSKKGEGQEGFRHWKAPQPAEECPGFLQAPAPKVKVLFGKMEMLNYLREWIRFTPWHRQQSSRALWGEAGAAPGQSQPVPAGSNSPTIGPRSSAGSTSGKKDFKGGKMVPAVRGESWETALRSGPGAPVAWGEPMLEQGKEGRKELSQAYHSPDPHPPALLGVQGRERSWQWSWAWEETVTPFLLRVLKILFVFLTIQLLL